MYTDIKRIWIHLVVLAALAMGSQAATINWTVGQDGTWTTGSKWVDGVAPVSGDSVNLGTGAGDDIQLNTTFAIQSGQSMVAGAEFNEFILISSSDLTLETGGTMDLGFLRGRFSAGGKFTIEPGATLDTDVVGSVALATVKYIADASGVTVWNNSGYFALNNLWALEVDLTNYDLGASGDTILLADYDTSDGLAYSSLTLTDGWSGTIDYAYDQGGGDLAIALINLVAPGAADTTPPVITLLGDNPMDVLQGAAFTDPGATAEDNVDGDISTNIVVTGSVDTNTIGTYTLDYDVSDAASNAATTVTRTVNITSNSPVTVVTWADGGSDVWESGANWVGAVAPTNGDSVALGSSGNDITLDSAFTIEDGQSLTATGTGANPELALNQNTVLTLATGGAMDIAFMRPRFNAGAQFIIEAGADLDSDIWGGTLVDHTVTYIADASGVTTWFNSGIYQLGAGDLVVDVSNYNPVNGTTLILLDYETGQLSGAYTGVTLTEGWNGTIDYAYDQGGGDLAIALTGVGPIVPKIWDNGGADSDFFTDENWSTDLAPVSGSDSVVMDSTQGNATLTTEFTIGSGLSMTATNTPNNGLTLRIGDGGQLSVATGGTLSLGGGNIAQSGTSGQTLTIEAGATAQMYRYWTSDGYTNRFIADENGVTTFEVTDRLSIYAESSVLEVDLSNYDSASGDTLVLFDYGILAGDLAFGSVVLSTGWTADLDYAYDQGGGDLAIALTNIAYSVTANTNHGTPYSWLDLYSLVTGGNYEAADLLDSDSDGKLNWEEYQEGTDPTGVGVAAPIPFTLVEGSPDTLTFSPPNTPWVIEASADGTEWGMLPQIAFVVNIDGTVTASVEKPAALSAGGSYRVVEAKKNSKLVVFLTEGQSNMVGWSGKTEGYYHMDDYPCPNMFQLSRGLDRLEYDSGSADTIVRAFQPLQTTADRSGAATSRFVSLDFYFAREYAKDHPDVDVLIVKNAWGGTGFVNNYWNEGDTCDVLADPYLAAALGQVSNDYATIEFGGILWHQGEADAANATSAAAYATNLPALFARHRGVVSNYFAGVQAPIVIGTMVPGAIEDNTTGYFDDINSIHTNIAALVENADYADLSGIEGRAGLHFVADGYQTAGEIYYDTWLEMQGITGKGTSRAWLDAFGLVAGGDYEAADRLDSDGDGEPNWQEYRDGTNPTGAVSAITFAVAGTNGVADVLNFIPPNTPWVIEATTDSAEWGVVPQMTFVVNDDGTVTATIQELPGLAAGGTYRVTEIPQNRKLTIFLTEGQSNMAGYAPDAPSNVYGMADHPLPNMLQMSHGHARYFYNEGDENELIRAFQPLQASEDPGQQANEADTALDFYFARAYAADHPDEDVLIIKNAYGGTGFANNWWNDGDTLDALVTPYFEGAFSQNDLSNRYETIRFGGILWHQGESDTKTVAASSAYAANLTAMVERHRSRVDAIVSTENTPFILGTMHYYRIDNYYSNFPEMSTVDAIHRDIANLIPNADCVDLHDLQGNTSIHFTVDEYKTMGERYYQKWLELATTSQGTPHRWLDLYGLVTGDDYEAADLLDSDNDGKLNWEEYQDGTDPTGIGGAAPIPFTLVEGSPDTLTFTPPNTTWHIEASTDSVAWGVVPHMTFVVNTNGSITATVEELPALSSGGTYRVVETKKNSKLVIFLTEGQSNMEGGSSDASSNVYGMEDHPLPNMLQVSRARVRDFYNEGTENELIRAFQPLQTTIASNPDAQTQYESNSYTALDFYFARAYAADHPDEDVLILKNAVGGTGFKTATDPKSMWLAGKPLDVLVTPYLQTALAQVSGDYTTIEFGGILWHQGEADANTSSTYATNLTELAARHRGYVENEIANSSAPFICGTMVSRWIEDRSLNYEVDAVHRNIANLVPNSACVDLSDLDQEGWQLTNHFLVDEYKVAGLRYYQKWIELMTTTNGTPKSWLDDNDVVTGGDYEAADLLDSDGDGLLNWQEYRCGTSPTNSASVMEMNDLSEVVEGQYVVVWQGVEGKLYNVLSTPSLAPASWSTNVADVIGVAPETVTTVATATASAFFKVELAE